MGLEERELLPLAEKHFKAQDWQRLADAFAQNQDPIADTRDDFRKLFARIVNLAPAPVGLGEPWKRVQPQS
jgi:branched-chain amino acid transport system ATP-binding protein